ncbi:hypothetical protein DFH08DRAFT_847948 [Mycena albidolilacea]|uniref:Uncharacterized protein n=1 Tax=Mycena albidolilacea TaxID=1033008 RepID=A0AAD7AGF1_9AGAR|nr:hypothetical protein DFH08DRAFT_847948 [Mycena albidolilacea]
MLELITRQLVYDFWVLAGIFPCDTSHWAYALEPVHSFSSAHRYRRLDGRLFTWLGASYPVGLITTNEWGVDGTKAAQRVGAPGLPFIAPLPRTHAGGFVADYIDPIGPQLSSHTDSRIHRALLFSAEAWPNPMPVLSRYLRDRFGLPSTFHLHSALVAVGHSSHLGYGRGPFPSLSSRPSLPIRLRVKIRTSAHQAKTFRVLILRYWAASCPLRRYANPVRARIPGSFQP